jgi:hypothetical protein
MVKQNEKETAVQDSKMAQLLADAKLAPRVLSRGEPVEGDVVAILRDSLLVDVGAKAEGIIPLKEVEGADKEYKIGDKISVINRIPDPAIAGFIFRIKEGQGYQVIIVF